MNKFGFIAVFGLLVACSGTKKLTNVQQQLTPSEDVTAFQEELDAAYRNPDSSPLKVEEVEGFEGLSFFPTDLRFRVNGRFVRTPDETAFEMPTSTERRPIYQKYGEIRFELNEKPYSLSVYQNRDMMKMPGYKDYLFLPYTDETNGVETYGGGRYIDFRIPTSEQVILDFNKSYNPYCAYNDKYSCPIPPRENHLSISIRAGVLAYDKH